MGLPTYVVGPRLRLLPPEPDTSRDGPRYPPQRGPSHVFRRFAWRCPQPLHGDAELSTARRGLRDGPWPAAEP